MPTLLRVQNVVDTRVDTLLTTQIQPQQAIYFAGRTRPRYFQGLETSSVPALPDNPSGAPTTVLEVVPNRNVRPTDQVESWLDAQIDLGATIPMVLRMDVYQSPQGHGYTVVSWTKWAGNVYVRTRNFGPETTRDQAWAQV